MNIRELSSDDISELKRIHEKHYPEDNFPDFSRLLDPLVVVDNNDTIISAGGVELIPEGVLITNKDKSPFMRGRALETQLGLMSATCHRFGLVDLHAFVANDLDEVWIRALKRYGFQSAGNALFKRIS